MNPCLFLSLLKPHYTEVILFLMFSGFFLNESNVPAMFIWLKEISFIRYAFQALCVNEFKGADFSCDEASTVGGGGGSGASATSRL